MLDVKALGPKRSSPGQGHKSPSLGPNYIAALHVDEPRHCTSDARCWLSRTTTAKASRDSPCTSPPAFSFSSALCDACSRCRCSRLYWNAH